MLGANIGDLGSPYKRGINSLRTLYVTPPGGGHRVPAMYRSAFYVIGLLLGILSALMLVPALVDFSVGSSDWIVFCASAAATAFAGGIAWLGSRERTFQIGRRGGYLITAGSWAAVSIFGSLPLTFSSLNISFTDAVFETVSGLTTTGSTVLVGLDTMAPGLLLWRSLLQWIGGVGIIVMAIYILPHLRVGGMQLFRTESSDISDKIAPRIYQVAGLTVIAYVGLTVACIVALLLAGMNLFDSANHAMTTLSTGGYSTKDASIGFYNSIGIECVLIVFMVLGALPLVFYAQILKHGRRAVLQSGQVPAFLLILIVAIAAMTVWRVYATDADGLTAFREAAFNVTSVLTDTGYATTDFGTWGTGAQAMFLVLMFIGGCAGSTAGGVKVFRWQLLFRFAANQLRTVISPNRIVPNRYLGRTVEAEMIGSVRNFFFMYILTWAVLTVALMVTGMDLLAASSAVAQAMANAGPGLGPLVGPGTNFAAIPVAAKWLLCLAMILGRLELTTVYVMLIPDYWRR